MVGVGVIFIETMLMGGIADGDYTHGDFAHWYNNLGSRVEEDLREDGENTLRPCSLKAMLMEMSLTKAMFMVNFWDCGATEY